MDAALHSGAHLEVLGVNHRTAPIDMRERLSIHAGQLPEFGALMREYLPDRELVLLSTCNRMELYVAGHEPELGSAALRAWCAHCELDPAAVEPYLYHHRDSAGVQHLFRVASSLDSMVVGEAEILGQVKQAYATAGEQGWTGKVLNTLFQHTFSVAKDVRTRTNIGKGRVSVASITVDFAHRIFSSLGDKTILVIGAGEAAEGVLQALVHQGATAVLVANRTYERAVQLSEQYEGSAIHFEQLAHHLPQADIVIGSSAAPHVVVTAEHVREARKQRRNRTMLFLDISNPRDFDPRIHDVEGVYLYNLDDLKDIVERHQDERQQEMAVASALVDKAVERFMAEFETPDLGPSIAAVRESWHAVREAELARTLAKLNGVSEADREEIRYLTERLVNKLLHQPLHEVKSAAREPEGQHVLRAFLRLMHLGADRRDHE